MTVTSPQMFSVTHKMGETVRFLPWVSWDHTLQQAQSCHQPPTLHCHQLGSRELALMQTASTVLLTAHQFACQLLPMVRALSVFSVPVLSLTLALLLLLLMPFCWLFACCVTQTKQNHIKRS